MEKFVDTLSMHEKKIKGDIGVTRVIAELTKQLWTVSIPISEHTKYDLIAEREGIIKRIQVRFTSATNGSIHVKLRTSWQDKKGNHFRKREKDDYDVLAVYCPESDSVYFIDSEEFDNSTGISLRLIPTKNNQNIGIRMADKYILI